MHSAIFCVWIYTFLDSFIYFRFVVTMRTWLIRPFLGKGFYSSLMSIKYEITLHNDIIVQIAICVKLHSMHMMQIDAQEVICMEVIYIIAPLCKWCISLWIRYIVLFFFSVEVALVDYFACNGYIWYLRDCPRRHAKLCFSLLKQGHFCIATFGELEMLSTVIAKLQDEFWSSHSTVK